ncbi:uncharacterized protein [Branchiostoma lanceolatum]
MSEGVLCKGFYKKKTQKAQLRDDNDVLFGVTTLVWNDKLKPYGFCLHGCIDGLSTTCPQRSRHRECGGGCNAVFFSLQPLRIEAFWSHLRPTVVWWIGVFQEMAAHGDLEVGNFLHKGILRFCFMPIIRQQLLEFMEDWNDRRIRPHRGATVPGGRPNVLFFLPERTGGDNFLNHLSQHDRQQAQHYCKPPGNDVGNEPLNMYLEEMMANMQRRVPDTWQEAAQLYIDLVYIASDP